MLMADEKDKKQWAVDPRWQTTTDNTMVGDKKRTSEKPIKPIKRGN